MEVSYQLTKRDVSQLFRYIRNKRSQMRPAFVYGFIGVMSILAVGSAVLFLLHPLRTQGETSWLGVVMVLLGIGLVARGAIVRPFRAAREAQRNPQVMSRKTMKVSAEGVYVKHPLGEATMHWPLFVDIVDDHDCYYLFMQKNNALIVPKRAFNDQRQAQAFYETARRYWQTAKNIASPHQEADPVTWPPPPSTANSQEPNDNP